MQDQQVQSQGQGEDHGKSEQEKPIAVAIITPSGTFPNDDDYRRTTGSHIVAEILALAAEKLKLTNTSDWVAFANDKAVEVNHTFKQNGLHDIVEIEWHKREGGGGA